jgi:hypothetical protein
MQGQDSYLLGARGDATEAATMPSAVARVIKERKKPSRGATGS